MLVRLVLLRVLAGLRILTGLPVLARLRVLAVLPGLAVLVGLAVLDGRAVLGGCRTKLLRRRPHLAIAGRGRRILLLIRLLRRLLVLRIRGRRVRGGCQAGSWGGCCCCHGVPTGPTWVGSSPDCCSASCPGGCHD